MSDWAGPSTTEDVGAVKVVLPKRDARELVERVEKGEVRFEGKVVEVEVLGGVGELEEAETAESGQGEDAGTVIGGTSSFFSFPPRLPTVAAGSASSERHNPTLPSTPLDMLTCPCPPANPPVPPLPAADENPHPPAPSSPFPPAHPTHYSTKRLRGGPEDEGGQGCSGGA